MIPNWMNALTCDNVDARLLLVLNADIFNFFSSEKISFPCKNLSLVKKKIVPCGGKVVRDSIIVCGIRFNCRKVTLTRSLMFTNSYLEFPFCLANILVWWLLTGH